MSDDMVVAGSSVTARQMKEFWKQVADGKITKPIFQALLDHQSHFSGEVIESGEATEVVFPRVLIEEIYQDLGLEVDLDGLWQVSPPGFWDVYLHPRVGPNKLVVYLKGLGVDVCQYINDLDTDVRDIVARPPGLYRVRFRARVEADEETRNFSANDIAAQGYNCITLRERLFLVILYFKVAGEHLDRDNLTRCDGSRFSGGNVPVVGWLGGRRKVYVHYCHPDNRNPHCRTRLAV